MIAMKKGKLLSLKQRPSFFLYRTMVLTYLGIRRYVNYNVDKKNRNYFNIFIVLLTKLK